MTKSKESVMKGVKLLGKEQVSLVEQSVPKPKHGEVLLEMKASGLCGSDLKYIYHEHNGTGGAEYLNVIAGHEPSGRVIEVGEGVTNFKEGDRVLVYHIKGCGHCEECLKGYMIGCTSPAREAYGWQRDGGHAEYLLADESTLLHLPDNLSYNDGAMIACGFGTAYQGILRAQVSGRDRVLVVGLGPVGLATIILANASGAEVIGVDIVPERLKMAKKIGAKEAFLSDDNVLRNIYDSTGIKGFTVCIDCSGSNSGRRLSLEAADNWADVVFLGEGGTVGFEPSPFLLHKQITLHGSWVTSISNMRKAIKFISNKNLKPDRIVTHKFSLNDAEEAYKLFAAGKTGKVVLEINKGSK